MGGVIDGSMSRNILSSMTVLQGDLTNDRGYIHHSRKKGLDVNWMVTWTRAMRLEARH